MKAIVHRKRGLAWEFEWDWSRVSYATQKVAFHEIVIKGYKPMGIACLRGRPTYTFPGQEVPRGE